MTCKFARRGEIPGTAPRRMEAPVFGPGLLFCAFFLRPRVGRPMVNRTLTSPPLRCRKPRCCGHKCALRDVHDRRRTRVTPLDRPGRRGALAFCASRTTCSVRSRPANRRSIARSGSRSTPFRLLSVRYSPPISPISGAIPPTRAPKISAAPWRIGCRAVTRCRAPLDAETEVIVLNGTREGLFLSAIAATRFVSPRKGRPAILVPNPCYAAYSAGALAAHCETVFLPALEKNGFLPDLDTLDPDAARAHGRDSISQARPIRRARSPTASISRA